MENRLKTYVDSARSTLSPLRRPMSSLLRISAFCSFECSNKKHARASDGSRGDSLSSLLPLQRKWRRQQDP